jgi:hypothetical protein
MPAPYAGFLFDGASAVEEFETERDALAWLIDVNSDDAYVEDLASGRVIHAENLTVRPSVPQLVLVTPVRDAFDRMMVDAIERVNREYREAAGNGS